MIKPANRDFTFYRGTTGLQARITVNPRDASGMPITQSVGASVLLLAGIQGKNLIKHSTDDGYAGYSIDPISGATSWDPSDAEIALMPVGGTKMLFEMRAVFSDGSSALFLFGNFNRAL